MMKRRTLFILGPILILVTTLLFNRGREADKRVSMSQEEIRKRFHHLEAVAFGVSTVLARANIDSNLSLTIEDAVRQVAKDKGYAFFQSDSSLGDWVKLNPDSRKWNNENENPAEISAYSIFQPRLAETTNLVIVGINFRGEHVDLAQTPAWVPLPVWEYEKVNSK